MTVKTVYSKSYDAKRKRIQRLPKIMPGIIEGMVKRDILEINKIFHDGIKQNRLGLEELAESTIISKILKGQPKPKSPLYGEGDDQEPRSYSSMLVVTRLTKGWKLSPGSKHHHSKKLTLKKLFKIHENGATITRSTKSGSTTVRIPPRPALLLSYRKWLAQKRKNPRERSKEVKKVMSDYINKGLLEKQ